MADIKRYFTDDAKLRVLRFEKVLSFGASESEKSFTIETSCLLHFIQLKLPAFTDNPTATVTVSQDREVSGGDRVLYSQSGIADGQEISIIPDVDDVSWPIPMTGVVKVTITLSGNPGVGGGDVEVNLYGV